MIEKIIKSSTDYLVRSSVIDQADRDIYEYGFHSLYNNLFDITFTIFIAWWTNTIPQMILYHIAFVGLRCSAGGYHAPTHLRCFMISTTILLLSILGIKHTDSSLLCIVFSALSTSLVWVKAPVEHENSPINALKRKRLIRISRIISLFLLIMILFFCVLANKSHLWMATALMYGMVSHSLLMIAGLIKSPQAGSRPGILQK